MKTDQTGPEHEDREPDARTRQPRRPYEAPRLIVFGHVRELTAGVKAGHSDVSLNSSLT